MREIRQMPISGYVTLAVWATLMAVFVYGMYMVSEGSRSEFVSMLQGPSVSEPSAISQLSEVPQALKNQLQDGLAALADTLSAYQTKAAGQ